jgi:hypothetical protein
MAGAHVSNREVLQVKNSTVKLSKYAEHYMPNRPDADYRKPDAGKPLQILSVNESLPAPPALG